MVLGVDFLPLSLRKIWSKAEGGEEKGEVTYTFGAICIVILLEFGMIISAVSSAVEITGNVSLLSYR